MQVNYFCQSHLWKKRSDREPCWKCIRFAQFFQSIHSVQFRTRLDTVQSTVQYTVLHLNSSLLLHTNFTNFTHYNILFTDHTEEITIDSGIKGPAVLDQIVEVEILLSLFLFKNHFFNFSSCKIVDKLTTKLFDHLFDRFWHIGFFYLTNWTHV